MTLPLVTITRDTETKDATLGVVSIGISEIPLYQSLEQLWRNNARSISRIPAGTYPMNWQFSPHHERNLWHIGNVPGRDLIEIHSGNTQRDTKGCIILGSERWTKDGVSYVLSSRTALSSFEARLSAWQLLGCTIEIIDRITTTTTKVSL